MIKIVFSSDWHLGLKTEEIDRTEEIFGIAKQIIQHCKEIKKELGKDKVFLVLGGDLFDSNNPSEKHIAVFLKVLGLLKENEINTYVLVGNHEAVADPNRLSCLSFIEAAKSGFPNVKLIEDIKVIKVGTFDTGPLYFTFLPHISRALIEKKLQKKTLKKELTTQEYINLRCNSINKKFGNGVTNYVFSHLNVHGAHGGSEENLLKKSEVYLPEVFTDPPTGSVPPTIVQGHIHSGQRMGNIDIIGSPIYCTFGERLENKNFAEFTFYGEMGKEDTVQYIPTKYRPFMELELDMINCKDDFFLIENVAQFLEEVSNFSDDGFNPIIKFDVTINPESNNYDWLSIKEKIQDEYECTVKKILPRIVIKRPIRSTKQKLGLDPKDAVKIYLKKNLKRDIKKAKTVWKQTQKYLEI